MSLNRREFLSGVGAVTLCGWRRVAAAAGCPDYYAAHLAHVAARVGKLAAQSDDGFWFITDPHVKSNHRQSGILIAELVRRTPLARTLCGGDLVEAFGKGYESDRAAVDFAIDTYRKCWVETIRSAGGHLYTAKGNHDFTVCHSYDTPEDRKRGFTYDGIRARDLVVGEFTERDVVTDEGNPEACYYYFDNAVAKIRYVVADTTDSQKAGDVPWGVVYGMHARQLAWMAGTAFASVPEGYGIVVMHHIPVTGLVGSDGDKRTFTPFRNLLEAYQNRGVFELDGKRYDFTSAHGRILIDVTGHHHCEMLTFQKGILHVTLPCDAAYSDYIDRSKPWCGTLPRKKRGTIAEQTFDAIQIDRKGDCIHFTRVGGGQDRTVHLSSRTVGVGKTASFAAPPLSGSVTWGCYDADRVTNRPHPTNRYQQLADYHTTFATISKDGVLTGVRPGEVVVVAMDAAFNREIFPVTVV